jgi:hypothetical protein
MPAKEIKELRQSGKLEEALTMAKAELVADPTNIWAKRNISWVYYEYLKLNNLPEHYDSFISWLIEIKNLELPVEEKMIFENVGWQIGIMCFGLNKINPINPGKGTEVFHLIQSFYFTKPSEGYSFLFKALHKLLKDTDSYLQFADRWDFKNFRPEDLQKEKMPNGKEIMSIAEQAYIAYTKHLLPKQTQSGEIIFDRGKAIAFLPILSDVVDNYPDFQYPAYFQAKLLLALGDKDNLLESLLPFAKKKRNDFWVWEILAEAMLTEPEKVFACYCKALSCRSPEEMLVSLRQKMAGILISKKHYNEARTEIELLINSRTEHGFRIPSEVVNWQTQEWYKNAVLQKSNLGFYKEFIPTAEAILFSDTPEETVIVDFVNSDRKILNFIASQTKFGFFKYERFFRDVQVGDTLKVRFQGGSKEGAYQVYTVIKVNDEAFEKQFMKQVSGVSKIPFGKPFGFLDDVFIHPTLVTRLKLADGMMLEGMAIKSYNQEKKQWGWKLVSK